MASEEAVEELQLDQPFDSTLHPEQSDTESLVGNCWAPEQGQHGRPPFLSQLPCSLPILQKKIRNVLA